MIQADLTYLKQLIGAGWEGVASAHHEVPGGVLRPSLKAAPWPAAVGATVGVVGARFVARRKRAPGMAIGGVAGSLLGFGVALAWASRGFARDAARQAIRRVNAERDAHWLATNPIDYA